MKVGRYDYRGQLGDLEVLMKRLEGMLSSGHYVLSAEVGEFEGALAEFLGAEFVLGVNSGTDALILSLRAAGIGPGDEVITQANTFHASVAAILWAGATPVLVDAHPETFALDPDALSGAITERTRALMPVHLYGRPAPLDEVERLAGVHDLVVVEDSAQSIGARRGGRRTGTLGDFGCFSFHPSKNLAAAGDGGAIVCRDAAHFEPLKQLRALGQGGQNEHRVVGLNSKLDALQAAILHHKLPQLDGWNADRRDLAAAYRAGLEGLPLGLQLESPGDEHAWHLFCVRTERRDALLGHLRAEGIDAVVRYPVPIHLQPAFAACGWRPGQYPVSERLAQELLALPVRPGMPRSEVEFVADSVRRFFAGGRS